MEFSPVRAIACEAIWLYRKRLVPWGMQSEYSSIVLNEHPCSRAAHLYCTQIITSGALTCIPCP